VTAWGKGIWRALVILTLVVLVALAALPAGADVVGEPFVGVKVSANANQRSGADGVIEFDHTDFEQGGEFWEAGGAVLIPYAGCYSITAQVTVLGNGYFPDSSWSGGAPGSNPSAPNWMIGVTRNGNPLDLLASTSVTNADGGLAQLSDASTVTCLNAGDFIELRVTPDLLVESNWPDTTGSISPNLSLIYEGSIER
jgi:hypothetical protein